MGSALNGAYGVGQLGLNSVTAGNPALGFLDMGLSAGGDILNYFLTQAQNKKMWQREDTAVQRRMSDMMAAGVNPLLAINGSVSSAASAMGAVPQSAFAPNFEERKLSRMQAKLAEKEMRVRSKELDLQYDNFNFQKKQYEESASERVARENQWRFNAQGITGFDSLYDSPKTFEQFLLKMGISYLASQSENFQKAYGAITDWRDKWKKHSENIQDLSSDDDEIREETENAVLEEGSKKLDYRYEVLDPGLGITWTAIVYDGDGKVVKEFSDSSEAAVRNEAAKFVERKLKKVR